MALPNIVNVTQIYGSSTGRILTPISQDVVTNTTNQTIKVNSIICSNVTGASQTASVYYYESETVTSFAFMYQLVIPSNSSIDILVRPFYLKENDKITAIADAEDSIHLVLSYEIILP
jgi:hypothetical protein